MRCLTELYTAAGLLRDGDGDGLPDGFGCRFVGCETPGAIDVAARLGLESAAFTPGFASGGGGPDALWLWFGPVSDGQTDPVSPVVAIPPGCGVVALVAGGVVVTGDSPTTGLMAARWLAATFPFAAPGGPLLADLAGGRAVRRVVLRAGAVIDLEHGLAGDGADGLADCPANGLADSLANGLADSPANGLADSPADGQADSPANGLAGVVSLPLAVDKPTLMGPLPQPPFVAPVPGDLPPPGPARLFSAGGLLGSSDGAQADRVSLHLAPDGALTAAEVAGLCELAARVGVESTGLRLPLTAGAGEPAPPGAVVIELAAGPPPTPEWDLPRGDGSGAAWTPGRLTVYGRPAGRAAVLVDLAGAGLVEGLHGSLFTRRAALPARVVERGVPVFDLTLTAPWEVDRVRALWAEQVLPQVSPQGGPVIVDLRLSEPQAVRQGLQVALLAELAARGVPVADVRVRPAYKQGFHWLEEEALPWLAGLTGLKRVDLTAPRFIDPGGALEMSIRWLQEIYPADELLAARLGVPVAFDLAPVGDPDSCYRLTAWGEGGAVLATLAFEPIWTVREYLPGFPHRGRVHPPTGRLRVEQGGRLLLDDRVATDPEAIWEGYQQTVLPRLHEWLLSTYGATPDPTQQPFFGALVIEASLSEENRRLGIREEQISPLDALHEDLYFQSLDWLAELGRSLCGAPYPAPGAVEPWVRAGTGAPWMRIRLYAPISLTPGPHAGPALAGRLPDRAAALPPPASAIPMDLVIGPDQLPAYLAYLATLPGVRVWRTGLSYGGRPTWAAAVTAPTVGAVAPPRKLSAWRPTLLVNARRHANEISSTNSILALAEWAATSGFASRVNLVISPLENVDGAALHYEMQREQPHWKLHAARFNGAGIDFGNDCFAPEPRFGESRTLPTLWRAFLPDVVLDDHGYPSHEWVQPFSGWNSPPYFPTSWWMPSALIYPIMRWIDPEAHPASGAMQEELRGALARHLTANAQIEGYTRILLDRYIAYGQRHEPGRFPLQMHDGLLCLTRRAPAGPDVLTFAGRFPHLTVAELITEVPDETAQGDYLALCARSHLEGDLAVAAVVASHPQPVVRRCQIDPGGSTWWLVGRERPFRLS